MAVDLHKSYDAWHQRRASSAGASDPIGLPWYASAFHHMQAQAFGDVLEIGCGTGAFAHHLANTLPALRVTAVDFSAAAIEIAANNSPVPDARLRFMQDDAQNLSFASESFDYIVSCECLEHVPNPAKMAAEIARVLRPGGRFCLTTENYLNGMLIAWAWSLLTGEPFNSGSGTQPHENFFVFWRVRRLLSEAGLYVEQTESCHYQWLLLPRVNPGRLCTKHISSSFWRRLAKPFGRHFSFFGYKPAEGLIPLLPVTATSGRHGRA